MEFAARDDGAGGTMVSKKLGVDTIDRIPLFNVGNIDANGEDTLSGRTGGAEDAVEIGEGLFGLGLDAVREEAGVGVEWQLAG